jgi:hypothetical protein
MKAARTSEHSGCMRSRKLRIFGLACVASLLLSGTIILWAAMGVEAMRSRALITWAAAGFAVTWVIPSAVMQFHLSWSRASAADKAPWRDATKWSYAALVSGFVYLFRGGPYGSGGS